MACTVDLVHTMLHLAALESYNGIQGQSLVPLVDDPGATVRGQVLIEDDGQRLLTSTDRRMRLRTLLTPDWRLPSRRFGLWGVVQPTRDRLEHCNLSDVEVQGAQRH